MIVMRVDEEQYLAHYGVLGMKWGTRRAVRNTGSVKSARKRAKQANREFSSDWRMSNNRHFKGDPTVEKYLKKSTAKSVKADKAYAKAKTDATYKELNKKYPGNSKALNKSLAKTSTGKMIAQTALMGSYGTLKYHEARVNGASRGKAVGQAILKNLGNNLTLGAMARKDKKKAMGKS